jgi:hypothetical protein
MFRKKCRLTRKETNIKQNGIIFFGPEHRSAQVHAAAIRPTDAAQGAQQSGFTEPIWTHNSSTFSAVQRERKFANE